MCGNKINIFDYQSPTQFLCDYFEQLKDKVDNFSIRRWSGIMGFSTPNILFNILNHKKKIRQKDLTYLFKGLKLEKEQRFYFITLVQFSNAKSEDEKEYFGEILKKSINGNHLKLKPIENTVLLSHWIYTTILAMTKLKGFSITPENIQKNLKIDIELDFIKKAIQQLKSSKAIYKNKNGFYEESAFGITNKNDSPDENIANYYRESLKIAEKSIQDPIDKRAFQSFTLPINKEDLGILKQQMREFRKNVSALALKNPNAIYQVNLNATSLVE